MATSIERHRDLLARQRAFRLGLRVHAATENFPKQQQFGLTNQMRRSGVSIAGNSPISSSAPNESSQG